MSTINQIKVAPRKESGTSYSRRTRKQGKIPAVVYGLCKEPQKILIDQNDWNVLSKHDAHIVKLDLNNQELNVLIKDVQFDYLSGRTMHIDFQEINMNEKITAKVSITIHGTPIGLSQGGVLNQYVYEIEVTCLPKNLPESIPVEVSHMELNSSIHVKDMKFPEGVDPESDPNLVLFHVGLPKAEEEKKPEAAAVGGKAAATAEAEATADANKKETDKKDDKKAEKK